MIGGVGSSTDRSRVGSPPSGLRSGSYKSESSGTRRTVVVVPPNIETLLPTSPDATMSSSQVAKMREAVKTHYGATVANSAFREIDYRQNPTQRGFFGRFGVKSGKDIRGHHLMTATLRALEMSSPNVRAAGVKQRAEATLKQVEPAAKELAGRLQSKMNEEKEILDDYSPMRDSFRLTNLRKEIEELKPQLEELNSIVATAIKERDDAIRTLDGFARSPLDATDFGKAQQRLDKVDSDLRFRTLLNDTYARGEALHGGSGTAYRMKPTSEAPKTVAKELIGIALPPIGVALAFRSAIKAEDRQRRLGNAAKFLDAHPLAKTVAKSMEAAAEGEKNKAAIAGTVSFVAIGATAHFAPVALPGLKAISNPLSSVVGSGVSQALTGHMGHVGIKALSTTSSIATGRLYSEVQGQTSSSLAPSRSGKTFIEVQPVEVPLPEGTIPPTIPVKIATDEGERTKEFDMTKAGPALLHYLGPQVGDTSSSQEQNRKELRDLFGAKPEDDLDPTVKRSEDERKRDSEIAHALDDPSQPGAADLIRSVSPLRLLHIAQGWR